jgi:hypothetical protein
MSSPKLKIFYRQLMKSVSPRLTLAEFKFDEKRTFRRVLNCDRIPVCQIIEFQVGIKSLTGKFTVNLAVYSNSFRPSDWQDPGELPGSWNCLPGKSIRLGRFYNRKRSLIERILRVPFSSHDHWWAQADKETTMDATFKDVTDLILGDGLAWLNENSEIASLRSSYDDLAIRRKTPLWSEA